VHAAWLVTCALVLGAPGFAGPQPQPAAPAFTAQTESGLAVYARTCANCHGTTLQGAAGPALSGAAFQLKWMSGTHTARELYDITARQMPSNAPGSLSESQNLSLLALMLARNGAAASAQPLSVAALDVPLRLAPTAAAQPPPPRSAGPLPAPPEKVEPARGSLPTDHDLLAIAPGDWLTYNRSYSGDRFSPLTEINTRNVQRLKLHCLFQLGEVGSFETSPIAFRGRLYVTTAHKTFALDATSCRPVWGHAYTPTDVEHLPGNRGAALYAGKVLRGTTDGHLIALDAETGQLLWNVRVQDGALGYEITGAPLAFEGKVFVGDSGGDTGIRARIYAFDAATGAHLWSFEIIPSGNQPGAETWGGGTEHGGGGTWSSMALDPHARLLFVPTANPAPDFNDAIRPGSNLYTDSVVALSVDTGQLAWYVQQVPHDVHDWDTAAAPVIYEQGARRYMAVASKNGLLHIYDRASHAVIAKTPFATRLNVDVPLSATVPVHVCPGALGQWNGPAYAPPLGLLFVGAADRCNDLQVDPPKYIAGQVYFGGRFIPDPPQKNSGWIRAFDAASGRERWAYHAPTPVLAAVTPTAGGVLLTGETGGDFLALDTRDGRVLYRFYTGGALAGGISTYAVGGHQYIAVASGNLSRDAAAPSGAATVEVFALP
jgi:PQQ-dependent dehydrogenase (methanol/ethanol family)